MSGFSTPICFLLLLLSMTFPHTCMVPTLVRWVLLHHHCSAGRLSNVSVSWLWHLQLLQKVLMTKAYDHQIYLIYPQPAAGLKNTAKNVEVADFEGQRTLKDSDTVTRQIRCHWHSVSEWLIGSYDFMHVWGVSFYYWNAITGDLKCMFKRYTYIFECYCMSLLQRVQYAPLTYA